MSAPFRLLSLFVEPSCTARTSGNDLVPPFSDLVFVVFRSGGLAGLALAARLSENANMTVAVIEAGTSGEEYGVEEKVSFDERREEELSGGIESDGSKKGAGMKRMG